MFDKKQNRPAKKNFDKGIFFKTRPNWYLQTPVGLYIYWYMFFYKSFLSTAKMENYYLYELDYLGVVRGKLMNN